MFLYIHVSDSKKFWLEWKEEKSTHFRTAANRMLFLFRSFSEQVVSLPPYDNCWTTHMWWSLSFAGDPKPYSCWVFLIYHFQSLRRIFHPSNALIYNMAQLTDNEETLTQESGLSSNPKPVWNLKESLERIYFHLLNSRECLWKPDLWYMASHHEHWLAINIKNLRAFD